MGALAGRMLLAEANSPEEEPPGETMDQRPRVTKPTAATDAAMAGQAHFRPTPPSALRRLSEPSRRGRLGK